MDDAIRAFMTIIELERHASHETVRSYASDLRQFQTFMRAEHPGVPTLDPATVQTESIRAYLHWLDRKRENKHVDGPELAASPFLSLFAARESRVGSICRGHRTPKQPTSPVSDQGRRSSAMDVSFDRKRVAPRPRLWRALFDRAR